MTIREEAFTLMKNIKSGGILVFVERIVKKVLDS